MTQAIQWIITGLIIGAAITYIAVYVRQIHRNPCRGCSLRDNCDKKKTTNQNKQRQ